MLSIIILVLILCIAYTWSTQGLFSALIHLVLTVLAGALAFAAWEPMVYGFLLYRMPEQAWGVGLLIPFGLSLLGLRTLFDKAVPGNLSFHNLADKIGGALLGFCSGVLTVGMLIIGLQMIGMPSLVSYQAYKLEADGRANRAQSLMVPVDTLTAGFFSQLSGGALSPMLSDKTLPNYHPALARESSFYHQSAFWTSGYSSSRRAAHPNNFKIVENGYSVLNETPPSLKDKIQGAGSLVVVGVEVQKQVEGGAAVVDQDSIYRVTANQVVLVTAGDRSGGKPAYPVGFIQAGEYRALNSEGEFAYSDTSASVTHHWVFLVPGGQKPRFLSIKQARLDLPAQANSDSASVENLMRFGAGLATKPATPPGGTPDAGPSQIARIDNSLPFIINRNRLTGFSISFDGNQLVSGKGQIRRDPNDQFSQDLAIYGVKHNPTTKIVKVNFGGRKPGSLFGRAIDKAVQVTQPPILKTASNKTYFAMGYVVTMGPAEFRFSFDPAQNMRSFGELEPGRVAAEHEVYLYFQVPIGEVVEKFSLGASDLNTIPINLKVQ